MAKAKKTESGETTTEAIPDGAAPEAPEAPSEPSADEDLSALAQAEEQATVDATKPPEPPPAPVAPPVFDDAWMSDVETIGQFRVVADGAFVGEHGLVHRLPAGTVVSATTHDLSALRGSGVKLERLGD